MAQLQGKSAGHRAAAGGDGCGSWGQPGKAAECRAVPYRATSPALRSSTASLVWHSALATVPKFSAGLISEGRLRDTTPRSGANSCAL